MGLNTSAQPGIPDSQEELEVRSGGSQAQGELSADQCKQINEQTEQVPPTDRLKELEQQLLSATPGSREAKKTAEARAQEIAVKVNIPLPNIVPTAAPHPQEHPVHKVVSRVVGITKGKILAIIPHQSSQAEQIEKGIQPGSAESKFEAEIKHRKGIAKLSSKLLPGLSYSKDLEAILSSIEAKFSQSKAMAESKEPKETVDYAPFMQELEQKTITTLLAITKKLEETLLHYIQSAQICRDHFWNIEKFEKEELEAILQAQELSNTFHNPLISFEAKIAKFHQSLEKSRPVINVLANYTENTAGKVQHDLAEKSLQEQRIDGFTQRDTKFSAQSTALTTLNIRDPETRSNFLQQTANLDSQSKTSATQKIDEALYVIDNIFLKPDGLLSESQAKRKELNQITQKFIQSRTEMESDYYLTSKHLKALADNLKKISPFIEMLDSLIESTMTEADYLENEILDIPATQTVKGLSHKHFKDTIAQARSLTSAGRIETPAHAIEMFKTQNKLREMVQKVTEYKSVSFDEQITRCAKNILPDLEEAQFTQLVDLEEKAFTAAQVIFEETKYNELKSQYEALEKGTEKLAFLRDVLAKSVETETKTENPEIKKIITEIDRIKTLPTDQLIAEYRMLMPDAKLDLTKPDTINAMEGALTRNYQAKLAILQKAQSEAPKTKAIAEFNTVKPSLDAIHSGYEAKNKGILDQVKAQSKALAEAIRKVRSEDSDFSKIRANHAALNQALTTFRKFAKEELCRNDEEMLTAFENSLDSAMTSQSADKMVNHYIEELYTLQKTYGKIPQAKWKTLRAGIMKLRENSFLFDSQALIMAHYIINSSPLKAPHIPEFARIKKIYFLSGGWARLERQSRYLHDGLMRGKLRNLGENSSFTYLLESKLGIRFGEDIRVKDDGTILNSAQEIELDDLTTELDRINNKITGCEENLGKTEKEKTKQKLSAKLTKYQTEKTELEKRKNELETNMKGTEKGARQTGYEATLRESVLDFYLHPQNFVKVTLRKIPGLRKLPRVISSTSEKFDKLQSRQNISVKEGLKNVAYTAKDLAEKSMHAPLHVVKGTKKIIAKVASPFNEQARIADSERKRQKVGKESDAIRADLSSVLGENFFNNQPINEAA
ncbi:hypothetical protein A2272_02150 [Candidatus Peregrinibacteria bacterium RIFOXYA12_FULL_33_12]|nr:MAG: hypothetical protein A2272_02150 [Candidatus Peregrinibacteria bacterium RIFOXYA12_FULL_33_12]OGJ50788.1 MAG: hypothetical protein A2307_01960 [Candidatus Peregrinibacteria bacterium RIFOXYB2_FULL_33_20]